MPNLDPGFLVPDENATQFEIVAIDWRGVERRSAELDVTVKATEPTITGGEDLIHELSATLLNELEHNITAVDEFGNSITDIVLTEISPGDYAVDARLDSLSQLPDGQTYTFTYQITDYRGVMVEQVRNLSIVVTAPELTVPNFQSSENLHPSGVPHEENSIEYKDPWGELPGWLSSITVTDFNGVSRTDLITLQIGGSDHADFSINTPDLAEGANELAFEVIDPRYLEGTTNSEWLDDLTTTDAITITVVKTLPDIVQSLDLPSIVPMEDPAGIFQSWIDGIEVKDVEGTVLSYQADESARASSEDGYFYLNPLPNLDPGFLVPDENATQFEIVAIDSREVERRSAELEVTVEATGATITGGINLEFELTDTPLNELEHNITAVDEFGTSITDIVLTEISPGDYAVDARLDSLSQLPDGQTYTFTYQITDYRGVMVEQVRNLSIVVTAPVLTVPNFQSSGDLHPSGVPHEENSIEYKDPWVELPGWLSSIIATDLNDVSRTDLITLQIDGSDHADFSTNTPDLAEGANELAFEVIDPRYLEGTTNSEWLDDLTTTDAITITVVKTPPVLTISYEPRDEIDWDGNTSTIPYLVKPNAANGYTLDGDNGDDGEFAFTFHSSQQLRKPYYQATAFNGDDIPNDQFDVFGVSDGLYDTLSDAPHHAVRVEVNDFSQRGTAQANGVTTAKDMTLEIVDVLPPYMILKDRDGKDGSDENDPIIIHGIVSHDNSVIYEFPDPGYQIVDNYYTESQVQSENNIVANPDSITFEYPESPNGISAESVTYGGPGGTSFMEIPDDLVFGEVSLSEANVTYELNYEPVSDPSNNVSPSNLTRSVRVVDNRIPEVHINGPAQITLNLYNILTDQENYSDYGAFAIEDLDGDGTVYWQESGWEDDWSVQVQEYNATTETYSQNENIMQSISDLTGVATTSLSLEDILDYFELLNNPQAVAELYGAEMRFKLTYSLTDKAGNVGTSANRIVDFTNSESLVPELALADHTIIPPYEVEVGELDDAPAVDATLNYSRTPYIDDVYKEYYLIDNQDQNTSVSANWDQVNYHQANDGTEYYVDSDGQLHTTDEDDWRKFIVHYFADNPSFPNFRGTLDLEIRIHDTTPPSFDLPGNINTQAGIAFVDDGYSSLLDNYDTDPVVTKIIREDTLDGNYTDLLSIGSADVFEDLADIGFWSPGVYKIYYTAIDDFNNSYEDHYSINVTDSIAPHISIITEDYLENPGTVSLSSDKDTETLYLDVPNSAGVPSFGASSYSVAEWSSLLSSISPEGWSAGTFNKESPYISYEADKTTFLKESEIVNLDAVKNGETSEFILQTDSFGRSFVWYSAYKIVFDDGSVLQDPGVLVVNPSDLNVTVSSERTITANSIDSNVSDPTEQLISIKFIYTAVQDGGTSNEIQSEYGKTLYFLDEEKPLIILSPEDYDDFGRTNSTNKFFLIEAGVDDLADERSTRFYLWEGDPDSSSSDAIDPSNIFDSLAVTAEDAVDGNLNSEIQRSYFNAENNESVPWDFISGVNHLNKVYRVDYDVRDGDNTDPDEIRNSADTASRYFIVKDTTPPVIEPSKDGTFKTLSATAPEINLSDINAVKQYMVEDLYENYVSDAGNIDSNFSNIDFNSTDVDWTVIISKELNAITDDFDGAEVYPEQYSENGGYYVTITVKDDSGNESDPITRRLQVGDNRAPTVYLIGPSVIHDFFRYGTNTVFDNNNSSSPNNEELLFVEQTSGQEYNSTGYTGGAHRLFLSNYNFVDPGVYAEDADPDVNSSADQGYFTTADGYPDYNGNGVGEGHVISRQDGGFVFTSDNMDVGIIYSSSELKSTTFEEMQNNLALLDTNLTNPGIVPNVAAFPSFHDVNKTNESLNIYEYTIKYAVRDGWNNISETKERTVYFYESNQFGDSAFYATPIYERIDIAADFPDRNLSSMSDRRKDYDGDGVSDYLEDLFNTPWNDASLFPDLSSHEIFSDDLNMSLSY